MATTSTACRLCAEKLKRRCIKTVFTSSGLHTSAPVSGNTKSIRGTVHMWNKFRRWQDMAKEEFEFQREEELQKKYIPGTNMYITAEKPEDAVPQKPYEDRTREECGGLAFDAIANHTMFRYIDWSFAAQRRHAEYCALVENQYDQRFLPERHLFLGPELASAHFIVHRDGSVKFFGDDAWYKKDKFGKYSLPGYRVSGLYVEAIDASKTQLMYEGLENFSGMKKIRLLRFADCQFVNDWFLSRMYQFEDSLEFLDLTNCKRITARGLSGLACLKKLKHLRLDGLGQIKDLAKTAIMLEDSIPGLEVSGLDYDWALEKLDEEFQLLRHPRVAEDARGNLHIQDEFGECYYVGGKMKERPVVDEESDFPLIMSKIKKDPPELPLEELEEIDKLSKGKLRHLLAGSPSGFSWTEESEKRISMEAKRLANKQIEVHPFLLPEEKRDSKHLEPPSPRKKLSEPSGTTKTGDLDVI